MPVNTIVILDALIKIVTIQPRNVYYVLLDIGGRFVITHAAVVVPREDAIRNLENALNVKV